MNTKISKFSKNLQSLVDREQKLRNEFSDMINREGGWSHELLKKFMSKHGTQPDDVFDSAGVEKELISIEPKLDYQNFSNTDWDNFWLLSQHMDKHPEFQKKSLRTIEKFKGKQSKEYKKLLFRIASNKGSIKTQQGIPVDLDKLDDMNIDWNKLSSDI